MSDPSERIAELPGADVSPVVARRIHARARGVFVRQARLAGRPWVSRLDRLWDGWFEPVAVTVVGAVQVVWVLETVRRLLGS